MGNAYYMCFGAKTRKLCVKLVFWDGTTTILTAKTATLAGEVMFQFPNMVVCHADSFYIGHPLPTLSIEDELISGQTYFVLPIDQFACKVLSVSSLSSLASSPKHFPSSFGGEGPFEYIKGANGRLVIKVSPEFLTKIISKRIETESESCCNERDLISTPELRQHYDQLVGYCKEQGWSPKLHTISESKKRLSPMQFLGFERRL
ncbi:hypothetical protein ACHQM5_012781 [Ranunculus cassubicifolius]